jgi:hypothetical protein
MVVGETKPSFEKKFSFLLFSFSFSFIAPAGIYLIEVVNPDYHFEPLRVDVTRKGQIRARMVNNIQPSQVILRQYSLRFDSKKKQCSIFQRENNEKLRIS